VVVATPSRRQRGAQLANLIQERIYTDNKDEDLRNWRARKKMQLAAVLASLTGKGVV